MAKTPEPVAAVVGTSASAPPPATPTTAAALPEAHDVDNQVRFLRAALQSDKTRLGCFLGAGCPLGIFDEAGERSLNHIPDVAGLTAEVRKGLTEHDNGKGQADPLSPLWDKLAAACNEGGADSPNVEHILSELRTLCARRGRSEVDGMSKERLGLLDETVCELIVVAVGKALPDHRCCYHRFASWVGGVQRLAPLDVFTPNYDLLVEEALEQRQIPLFDGFVGSREPFFDVASIEQDAIPARWTRIWKLHGSINWQKRDDGGVFRVTGRAAFGKAMIFPSHLKYDQSRRMPYLAMLDRLKAFFRPATRTLGLGPPVLVVSGYSFSDDHLNEVLLDGLRGNPSAQCYVLTYLDISKAGRVLDYAASQHNLTVLASDGAVVGTRKGRYRAGSAGGDDQRPWLYEEESPGGAGAAPAKRARCRLGDFHFFGLFLEDLCGGSNDDSQDPHNP